MMQLAQLVTVIEAAGGGPNALDYAEQLLAKVNRLKATGHYERLLGQLSEAREQGDFRGRVLEVNFADQLLSADLPLTYGVRQGRPGDVDFGFRCGRRSVAIEMKLLREAERVRAEFQRQLDEGGVAGIAVDDMRDIGRMQFDLIQKATVRKFNPEVAADAINIVAVDVSELQVGTVDMCDCLLAAGGNTVVARHCDQAMLRPGVVGVFERLEQLTEAQREWVARIHRVERGVPHPRDYIHGALFLVREPAESAALSYSLRGVTVWNPALVTEDVSRDVATTLARAIPGLVQ